MKTVMLSLGIAIVALTSIVNDDSKKDKSAIEKAVKEFVTTADAQDYEKMGEILDINFTSVVNRIFGGTTTSITNRETYIQLLKDKKIGGDSRAVEVHSVAVNGNNACAKATFDGEKIKFETFILLAKQESGDWKVVTDFPAIEMK